MKVALILSGKFRDGKECFDYLQSNLLEKYDVDVFINYWYDSEYDVDTTMQELIELYKPKAINFQKVPNELYPILDIANTYPKHTEVNINSLFSMWGGVKFANQLKTDYENRFGFKYDSVIRTRFDIKILEPFELKQRENSIHIPIGWDHRGGYNDLFAYGDSISMDYYCSAFDYLLSYTETLGVVHPESLLKQHLDLSTISIFRVPIKTSLRGMLVHELEYTTK
jgi:hypothetical protein